MKTVLINGYDRSGKSTFGEILKSKGYLLIELGEVVKKIMLKKNILKSEITQFYDKNIESLNEQIMEQLIAIDRKNDNIVISGCRSYNLFDKLNQLFNPYAIFFIESDREIRYERSKKFDKYDRSYKSLNLFKSNDLIHIGWGLEKIKKESILIKNNDSFEDYIDCLTDIIIKYDI